MKSLWVKALFFLFLLTHVYGIDYSLAFVHIGHPIPSYIFTTLQQARYMNEECPIYFLIDHVAYEELHRTRANFIGRHHITLVDISTITPTLVHEEFQKANRFNVKFRNGFWNHVTERFFYLDDFMLQTGVQHLIQIETDVMLYADVSELMPGIISLGAKVAAPFQWKTCCIPSFVYFKDQQAAHALASHILSEILLPNANYEVNVNDMCTLASFRNKGGEEQMTVLPILMPEYADHYPAKVIPYEHGGTTLSFLSQNSSAFEGYIFDAAALGIYVKGYDRRNGPNYSGGAVHPKSLFDPSHFTYFWGLDSKEKRVPYLKFMGRSYQIIDLHFHSKMPEDYTSFRANYAPLP